jgi:hypothetical protein
MAQGRDGIRIPNLRAVVVVLVTLTATGVVVFLRRYRGADRTALALDLILSAGLCLILGLAWFHRRFGGRRMSRGRLREIGLRVGIVAGVSAVAVSAGLLALRWALDQQASLVAERVAPAFLHALRALGVSLATGLPAYLALGAVMGALLGLGVAEAIRASARREPGGGLAEFEGPARIVADLASRPAPISRPSLPS